MVTRVYSWRVASEYLKECNLVREEERWKQKVTAVMEAA